MGSALNAVKNVGLAAVSPVAAIASNADALGIGGKQEEYWQPEALPELLNKDPFSSHALNRNQERQHGAIANQGLLNQYASGNGTLTDMLNNSGLSGDAQQGYVNTLFSDPRTASLAATEQVQNNPILGQLFGKGGALERTNAEEQQLASRGYSLQPEDYEAYGQMSDELARQFGAQEQNAAQAMANRGLGSSASGQAGTLFSGLQGNKFEQLAKAQRDVADKRMQMNMQRLTNTRNFMSQLGQQGAGAIQDQYGRNTQGVDRSDKDLQNLYSMESNQFNNRAEQDKLNLERWGLKNKADMSSLQDKRDNKQPTLWEGLGQGLFSSAYNVGSAPGKMVSSAAGGAGKTFGSMGG
jgi:hypothetical protein